MILNLYDICYNILMEHDLTRNLKEVIAAQNISHLSRESGVPRSVIYDFLENKNITSRHLLKLMDHSLFTISPRRSRTGLINLEHLKINKSELARLLRLLDLLVELHAPRRIILFGSRARGDFHADSDYDLCVVDPRIRHPKGEAKLQAHKARIGIYFDNLLMSSSQLRENAHSKSAIEYRILHEGITLYDESQTTDSESPR